MMRHPVCDFQPCNRRFQLVYTHLPRVCWPKLLHSAVFPFFGTSLFRGGNRYPGHGVGYNSSWPGLGGRAIMTREDDWFREALDHHRAGRLPEAAGLYQKVLTASPGHTDALYLLGAIAHQTGHHAQAVELSRRALAAAPDDARCYNVLGLA